MGGLVATFFAEYVPYFSLAPYCIASLVENEMAGYANLNDWVIVKKKLPRLLSLESRGDDKGVRL